MRSAGTDSAAAGRQAGILRLVALLLLALLGAVAPALATAGPAEAKAKSPYCLVLDLTGVGQDLGNFRTAADIFAGDDQVGTTRALFNVTGQSGTVLSFTGPLTYTPLGGPGTITAQLLGTVDISTGTFSAMSVAVSGTGPLHGVTGTVLVEGVQTPSETFTETLTGELCIPAARAKFLVHAFTGS